MTETTSPRIYVADLAACNAGILRGVWIDATQEPAAILTEVQAMLAGSPEPVVEEWSIDDHEGFEGAHVDEYGSFEHIHTIALFIEGYGQFGAELLKLWNNDLDECRRLLEDGYHLGAWDSVADYVQDLTEQTTEIPERLR